MKGYHQFTRAPFAVITIRLFSLNVADRSHLGNNSPFRVVER
jgi:hypothetical protein